MAGRPLAAVVSAGLSRFGRREGLYWRELFVEAAIEAFERCPNLDPKRDVKAVFVGHMGESYEHQGHTAPTVADWLGLTPVQGFRLESACASSGAALRCAVMAIASNLVDVVLVGGVEKMTHRSTPEVTEFLAMASDFPFEQWNGLTFPGLYALMTTAHMHKYGTTEEQLAMVAVKNHRNATMNPKAQFQRAITVEEVLKSRVIAWPLKLLDCSPITDGASCAILVKPELAKRFTDTPVYVIASAGATDKIGVYEREDMTTLLSARAASQEAYKMAGIEPKDVDVAEVHDCFTIAEIMLYEDLGFCPKGYGGKFIEEGQTEIGGKIPINTSGGLKAKGHPVGATGVAQLYEVYLQLTNQAGPRQVAGAEIGMTHNMGGSGASAFVHIYRRGD